MTDPQSMRGNYQLAAETFKLLGTCTVCACVCMHASMHVCACVCMCGMFPCGVCVFVCEHACQCACAYMWCVVNVM